MSDNLPARIVSLQPSATAILRDVGELGRVAACTRYCVEICPEAAQGRLIVSDSWTADSSEILAAHPDLVIAAIPFQPAAVTEILKAGCRFLGLAPRTLEDVYKDVVVIAGTVGATSRGNALIEHMRREVEQVRAKAARVDRPRVFCEEWGKPLIASQPWVADLVEAAGGTFLGEPGKQIDAATVRELDPDVLIAAWCGAGNRVPLEKIVHSRNWENMRAVKSGQVYCIADEFLNTPAPTLLQGLKALASAIHPDRFPPPAGLRRIAV